MEISKEAKLMLTFITFSGISGQIETCKDEELPLVEELVKYFCDEFMISGKHLIDKLEMRKSQQK